MSLFDDDDFIFSFFALRSALRKFSFCFFSSSSFSCLCLSHSSKDNTVSFFAINDTHSSSHCFLRFAVANSSSFLRCCCSISRCLANSSLSSYKKLPPLFLLLSKALANDFFCFATESSSSFLMEINSFRQVVFFGSTAMALRKSVRANSKLPNFRCAIARRYNALTFFGSISTAFVDMSKLTRYF